MIHMYNGRLFSHEKEWDLATVMTWMDPKGTMLSEIIQIEKEKFHMIPLIYGI